MWFPFAFLAVGLAAAGAEATTPILSQFLYGKDVKDLNADEKATVSARAGLTGAATGAVVGGSMVTLMSLKIYLKILIQ